jgi:hypothetical protein
MKMFICCAVLCLVSGCTGIELGGRVGLYRVDERQESSRTNVENKVPLKCYFVDCFSEVSSEAK